MKRPVDLTISATIDDGEMLARTVESLARVMSGLGMEGVTVTLTVSVEQEVEADT